MKICKKLVADSAVTFEFANGESVVARIDSLPEDMVKRLAIHGLSQKIGDSYASAKDVAEALEKAQDTLAMLVEGDWSTKRESTGGALAEALHRATDQTLAECQRILGEMSDEKKKELRKHKGIAAALAAITAEKAAEKAAKLAGGEAATTDLADLF